MEQEISRVTRSKKAARMNYDRMSRWYDLLTASEKSLARIGLQELNVQPGERILEIGCGSGYALLHLANSAAKTGEVCGIDISGGMLQKARKRLQKAGLNRSVHLHISDAARLGFKDNHFDAVFMCFTLELFDTPEIPIVLSECRRVLRQRGRICVVALHKEPKNAVRLYEWFHARLPTLVDCRPIYVKKEIEKAHLSISRNQQVNMWGLPVMIVVVHK